MSTRARLLAGALAALAVLGLWLRSTLAHPVHRSAVTNTPRSGALDRTVDRTGPPLDDALERPAPGHDTRDAVSVATAEASPPSDSGEQTGDPVEFPLVLRFLRPDREPLTPDHVRVALESADGITRTIECAGQHELSATIAFGVYRVRVEAEGLRHVEETFDLSSEDRFENRDPNIGFFRRVYLWPEAWIPVRVRTPDGAPFEGITEALGWEPRRLFVDAFTFAASAAPIGAGTPVTDGDSELARFRPPKGWHSVRMADDVVGSLEVLAPRPFWVGLWIHGQHHESRVLDPDAEELVFVASREQFEDRLCEVRLRLVDRDSGRPVSAEALATLKANTSAHRRDELRDRAPADDGTIVFDRVIPGRHDLTLRRGGSFIQRQLVLDPGATLDLGEIRIGLDPPIQLTVVDAKGRPMSAIIEITPYEKGGDVDDLYHPNLHRTTNAEGEYELPVPEVPSIVRARPWGERAGVQHRLDTVGTRNVLVDPSAPPATLELRARPPVSVELVVEGGWQPKHRVTVEDPILDLVIATGHPGDRDVRIVTGDYRLRHVDGDGREIGRRDVRIEESTRTVSVP